MKKLIITNAFLTKADETGKQWLRVTFYDPSSGLKASRLFDASLEVAYPVGSSIEAEIKDVTCEPYSFTPQGKEAMILNSKNTVVLRGENDIQALARNHGKDSIPESLRFAVKETAQADVAVK